MHQKSVGQWPGRLYTCHWAQEVGQSSDPASAADWLYSLGHSPLLLKPPFARLLQKGVDDNHCLDVRKPDKRVCLSLPQFRQEYLYYLPVWASMSSSVKWGQVLPGLNLRGHHVKKGGEFRAFH